MSDPIGIEEVVTCHCGEHVLSHPLVTGKKDRTPVADCRPLFDQSCHSLRQHKNSPFGIDLGSVLRFPANSVPCKYRREVQEYLQVPDCSYATF